MSLIREIEEAEKLLAERKEVLTLRGRDTQKLGQIVSILYDSSRGEDLCVKFDIDGLKSVNGLISVETLERWIKQIKSVKKKGYI